MSKRTSESEYRKKNIRLPENLVEMLFGWHSGTDAIYVLATNAQRGPVSMSMIEAADIALSKVRGTYAKRRSSSPRELDILIDQLEKILAARRTYRVSGPASYDTTDYGWTSAEEQGNYDYWQGKQRSSVRSNPSSGRKAFMSDQEALQIISDRLHRLFPRSFVKTFLRTFSGGTSLFVDVAKVPPNADDLKVLNTRNRARLVIEEWYQGQPAKMDSRGNYHPSMGMVDVSQPRGGGWGTPPDMPVFRKRTTTVPKALDAVTDYFKKHAALFAVSSRSPVRANPSKTSGVRRKHEAYDQLYRELMAHVESMRRHPTKSPRRSKGRSTRTRKSRRSSGTTIR